MCAAFTQSSWVSPLSAAPSARLAACTRRTAAPVSSRVREAATRVTVVFGGGGGGRAASGTVGEAGGGWPPPSCRRAGADCACGSGVVSLRPGVPGSSRWSSARRRRAPGRLAGTCPSSPTNLTAGPVRIWDDGRVSEPFPPGDVLLAAVDVARAAAVETAGDPGLVGEHLG